MALPRPFRAALVAAVLLGFTGRTGAADAPATPLPPLLPESSIAAVLARRAALELTPEQVKELQAIQARLAEQQASAREEAAAPSPPPSGAPTGSRPPGPGPSPGTGPGMAGGKTHPPPISRPTSDAARQLEARLDDLDTQAFLRALEILPESQREKAVDVASRYREQLFEQRERDRKR